jgi:acyl-coenzyme A synthetase/AMP-(fatty) acid ligase
LLSGQERFPTLRLVRLAGEPLYRSDVELFRKYFSSDCVLTNSYASTETGLICSYYLDKSTEIIGHRVPVGYPVKDKEVAIIDDEGNELPVSQPGQIVVKSRFLSAGYWQRGEESRDRFRSSVANPETKNYRTGDFGQLSADGCLTHLGRKDDRVKIRNFRVDIGEVEAMLAEHPEVKLASVTAKEDSFGDTRLIAYFVPRNRPAATVTSLREFLGAKLPAYMVPSAFVELAKLPLTGTGKVNRRALPDPGKSRPKSRDAVSGTYDGN